MDQVLGSRSLLAPPRGSWTLITHGSGFGEQVITVDQNHLNFRYFDTNYSTVVAEVRHVSSGDTKAEALGICRQLSSPTLIYCKSAPSAYELAQYLVQNGVTAENTDTKAFSDWLSEHYHPEWALVPLLKNGFAIHHGALPRSVAYHLLRKFNEGSIRFLLCTSTIIEGVNTAAENIVTLQPSEVDLG